MLTVLVGKLSCMAIDGGVDRFSLGIWARFHAQAWNIKAMWRNHYSLAARYLGSSHGSLDRQLKQ